MAVTASDERWMSLALALGRRGHGRCWPNPAVGCVIVRGDIVVGRGWTQPGGRPHGETQALAQAGARARGATVYVTLEPCAHTGKTPPCAEALVAAGVARVVSALEDPDPRVAGQGHAILRSAGIEVETGLLAAEAAEDHAGFLLKTTEKRPLVTLKLASSFDGRIATAGGESQWITGPAARRYVHYLRATHDAVLVGAGTALADDPSLTVRDLGVGHQPVRVVCDSRLTTPATGQLGKTAREVPVWMCHGPKAPERALADWAATGAKLVACEIDEAGRLDIASVLRALASHGLTRVFSEGGGQIAASLLADGVVDRLIGFTAGLALGAGGLPSVALMPDAGLAAAKRFQLVETRAIGADVLHVWRRS